MHSAESNKEAKLSPLARQQMANRRRSARRNVVLSGICVNGSSCPPHRATVCEMSQDGLQIRTAFRLRVGERVELALPVDGSLLFREGIVRFCRRVTDETGTRYMIGVRIDCGEVTT